MYSSDGCSENVYIYTSAYVSSGAEVDEEGIFIHDQSRMMFYFSSTPSPLLPKLPSEPHKRNINRSRNRNKREYLVPSLRLGNWKMMTTLVTSTPLMLTPQVLPALEPPL